MQILTSLAFQTTFLRLFIVVATQIRILIEILKGPFLGSFYNISRQSSRISNRFREIIIGLGPYRVNYNL